MALRKEPERRYGSVDSFAEDLQRHLEQRPVLAREASPWERLVRFWRRNFGGFAASFLVAMSFALCGGRGGIANAAQHSGGRTGSADRALPRTFFDLQLRSGPLRPGDCRLFLRCSTGAYAPLGTRAGKAQRVGAFAGRHGVGAWHDGAGGGSNAIWAGGIAGLRGIRTHSSFSPPRIVLVTLGRMR